LSITIGIDPSYTGTGIIALDTDTGNLKDQLVISTTTKYTEIERVRQIWKEISAFLVEPIDAVVIEGLAFAKKNKAHQMGYLHYRLREYLEASKTNPLIVIPPPSQLKKFVTGTGNAGKEIMLKEVYKRWGFDANDNNLADAYGLACIGRGYVGAEPKLIKCQQEVIAVMKGEKVKKTRKK